MGILKPENGKKELLGWTNLNQLSDCHKYKHSNGA